MILIYVEFLIWIARKEVAVELRLIAIHLLDELRLLVLVWLKRCSPWCLFLLSGMHRFLRRLGEVLRAGGLLIVTCEEMGANSHDVLQVVNARHFGVEDAVLPLSSTAARLACWCPSSCFLTCATIHLVDIVRQMNVLEHFCKLI